MNVRTDQGWKSTLEVYERKTRDTLQGKVPGGGVHVHVYAFDMQYILEELKELEVLRAALGKRTGT